MKIRESGITLIALVVTIVVLLILAGVSISMLTGENGIITQAQQANIKNDNGTVLEALRLKLSQYLSENEGTYVKDKLELLRDDNIIDENNIVNVLELVEQKLDTGNGNNNKDIYVIEENHLYYYDKKGNKTDLGDLGNVGETIAETDPNLFEITDDGTISLKYYDNYYNDIERLPVQDLVIPRTVRGITVKKISNNFLYAGDEFPASNTIGYDLKTVIIPETVIEIGQKAFQACRGLTSITIPDSITSIGYETFRGCDKLVNITIPDSVTSIGGGAFSYCRALTDIIIPDSVISIGYEAFYACDSLTNIIIPESVRSIGEDAFASCNELTNIIIKEGLTSIGKSAFSSCDKLTSITIPESVTSIEEYAFLMCDNLKEVYYKGTEQQWNQITIGSGNEELTNAEIKFNQ